MSWKHTRGKIVIQNGSGRLENGPEKLDALQIEWKQNFVL